MDTYFPVSYSIPPNFKSISWVMRQKWRKGQWRFGFAPFFPWAFLDNPIGGLRPNILLFVFANTVSSLKITIKFLYLDWLSSMLPIKNVCGTSFSSCNLATDPHFFVLVVQLARFSMVIFPDNFISYVASRFREGALHHTYAYHCKWEVFCFELWNEMKLLLAFLSL